MGCVSSKTLSSPLSSPDSPIRYSIGTGKHGGTRLDKIKENHAEDKRVDFPNSPSLKKCGARSIGKTCGFPVRLGSYKSTQCGGGNGGDGGEQHVAASASAAAWPAWLTAAAPQAVEGWLPLGSDKFQKLEKVILFVF